MFYCVKYSAVLRAVRVYGDRYVLAALLVHLVVLQVEGFLLVLRV